MEPSRVLVLASTFPAEADAEVPAFVRDLVEAMQRQRPSSQFAVLAPQRRALLPAWRQHPTFEEFRYRYAWPSGLEALTDHGIMPTLRQSPWLLPVVPALFVGLAVALRRMIKTWRPDVIHAHWFTPQGIVAVREGHRAGIPVVITSHASDVRIWRLFPGAGTAVVRRYLPRATRFTTVSERTRDAAAAFFPSSEWATIEPRTRVIPMGVTPVSGSRSERRLASTSRRRVLFLGRLAEKKGVGDLISAVARLAATDVTLVIAGDGPERAALETAVRRAGLAGRSEFLGHITGGSKQIAFAEADVLVLPSIVTSGGDMEGLPVVLLEGLAAGVPCIATDASGAGEVITHGETGWIVPQRNPEALASLIDEVLKLTPTRRAEVAAAGRALAGRYSWDGIAARYWQVLCEAVSS